MSHYSTPLLHGQRQGFTLIEILAVITIVGILAAIALGALSGVQENSRRTLAKGELAAIASALHSYKLKNGDYPWMDNISGSQNNVLFEALFGKEVFLSQEKPKMRHMTGSTAKDGKGGPYLDVSRFRLGKQVEGGFQEIEIGLYDSEQPDFILDPWGEPYYYRYKEMISSSTWVNPGFVLWSGGAYRETNSDETDATRVPSSGIFKIDDFRSAEENEDDLVYGYID